MGFNSLTLELCEESTVDNLVKELTKKYKTKTRNALLMKGSKSYKFIIMVNRSIISNHKEAKLKDGDIVHFLIPTAGG